ncbi:putative tricarboxylic transport membrane protein [Marinobacterium lutimaris]|uniref:Putative tricarboxylic transport membrane protein n=1 Tax=Marinobacterium lutimaris TaxID=568106 RepID=A0A1H6DT79_9GAMM|nr:putative tricarboxylic transport membrane protein [Marinobacterium lutimaris]
MTLSYVIGGLISCIALIIAAPQLANFATNFGSVKIFAQIVLALTYISEVSKGAMNKGLLMGIVGSRWR